MQHLIELGTNSRRIEQSSSGSTYIRSIMSLICQRHNRVLHKKPHQGRPQLHVSVLRAPTTAAAASVTTSHTFIGVICL